MEIAKKVITIITALAMVVTMSVVVTTGQANAAAKGKYKLEVSQKRCVVVAYKKTGGKWKYVRTMRCSTGTGGRTPNGTFHLGGKQRWGVLMGPVFGQYCCNITSSILFHSVWYNSINKTTQSAAEFNKLGRPASHGCVRLATIDAKWIYDNCKSGTLIKIGYGVKVPKGKPKKIHSSSGWDPTDPDPANPKNKLRRAKIKAPAKKLTYKGVYRIKKMVKATNPNALENITDKVTAKALVNGKWKSVKRIPTNIVGKVKVKYSVKYKYCKKRSKVVTYKVVDKSTPVITASSREVTAGDTNAVTGVTAKLKNGKSITSRIKVTIVDPNGRKVAKQISYSKAKAFVFKAEGTYKVTYKVANPRYPDRVAKKTVKITAVAAPQPEEQEQQ